MVALTPLAVAGAWMRVVILDTEQYVSTVTPLVDEPAVQAALADQVGEQVIDAVDASGIRDLAVGPVQGLLDDVLDRLASVVREQTARVVATDAFADAWESANRASHALVVSALTGEGDDVVADGTSVTVRGQDFADAARAGLTDAGFGAVADLVPDVEISVVVLSSDSLPAVQQAVRLLDAVGGWMWALVLVLGAAVVLVAPVRTLGLALAAGAVGLGSLVMAGWVALVRARYVSDPGAVLSVDARAVIFEQMTGVLRSAYLWTLLVAVLVMALAGLMRRLSGTPAPSSDDQSP